MAILAFLVVGNWIRVNRLELGLARIERTVDALLQPGNQASTIISPLLLDYQIDYPGRGEIFPAMVATAAPEYWPVAILRVTNTGNRPAAQTISAEIPGWSYVTEQSIVVGARETVQIPVQVQLLPRAYENHEIRRVMLIVRATSSVGDALYAESRHVLLHSGGEIYWGRKFANVQMAARWVTPHDPAVLDLISKARAYIPRGRMAGYSRSTGDSQAIVRHVRAQARAIFRALQKSGISYVSSLFVMGEFVGQAQRLRLPNETLHLKSANCMDVSLVFASAMENLGMEPMLIILPGHAITGVRLGRESNEVLYLDLTVLPKGSFETAIARAQNWLKKTPESKILAVDIASTRLLGVYPLVHQAKPETLSTFSTN
jgi:hypothetical protein